MSAKRQLVAEQWNDFAKVLPPDCSVVQRTEMRRAFYAGAHAILFRIMLVTAPEDDPTEEDLNVMQGIEDELHEFARMVLDGRA